MSGRGDSWQGWWERFASLWGQREGGGDAEAGGEGRGSPNRLGPVRGLLIAGLLGAGLLAFGQSGREEAVQTGTALPANGVVAPAAAGPRDVIAELERQVTVALAQVAGVGGAEVIIVPEGSEVRIFAEEVTERVSESQASTGGREPATISREHSVTRRPVILNSGSQGGQEPLVQQTKLPAIAGVLVVAEGADDPRVRLQVLRAVSTLLDVPPHRVEVVPRK